MDKNKRWYQKWLPHLRESETLSLNLPAERKEAVGGISFDAISAGWYLRNGYPNIYAILTGGQPAWSGETVSLSTALNHSVVWGCNKIISESIGFLPAILHQRVGTMRREAVEHPMFAAMRYAPNDEISAQGFTELLTSHCVMTGNGYAHIVRRSGTGVAIELHMMMPETVLPDREKDGARRLVYIIHQDRQADKTYTVVPGRPHDILHLRGLGWDGLRGWSVLVVGRQSIGSAIAAERNIGRFWAMGGRVPYHLELPANIKFKTQEDADKFRDEWNRLYSDPHIAPMLENGIMLKPDGLNMRDSQGIENRQYTIADICRWFGVSPHLVFDLSRATFSNIENLALQFVKFTLNTWLWRWEQDFYRCVLTPEEKSQGYYLRHNIRELLRGDFVTRMQGYATALQNGIRNQDECRAEDEMNPIPNGAGEEYRVQLNMQGIGGANPTATSAPFADEGMAGE